MLDKPIGDWWGAIPDFTKAIALSPKGSADRAVLHLRRSDCIHKVLCGPAMLPNTTNDELCR